MGEGSWDLEEGRHPEFLRGVGAGRGGGEPGAGCLGTKQEAGFLVSPPWAPPIPVNFLQFCFPTQTARLTSLPSGAEAGKSSPPQEWRGFKVGTNSWPSLSRGSADPRPTTLFPPPASPPALSTQELAAQEVVSLLTTLTPRSLLSLRCPPRVGFSPPLLPSSQPHWDWDRHGSSRTQIQGCQALKHTHIPPALVQHSACQSPLDSRCLVYSVDKMCLKCET